MNDPITNQACLTGFRLGKRQAGLTAAFFLMAAPAFASCPVANGGVTLVVRAPGGHLVIDTSGGAVVEVELTNKTNQIKETCGRDTIEVTGVTPFRSGVDWTIRTPKSINLDLTTNGGSITVKGEVDGEVKLRTSGGGVTASNIRRNVLLYTQAGAIHVGNIGGNAELHSEGGNLDVGDVAGSAMLKTASGVIRAGNIGGSVKAETGGGSITIRESRGEYFVATTKAGDIVVTGDARKIDAQTEGGGITVGRARGAFRGRTESGDIRVDLAQSSIDAYSGFGDIVITLAPETASADLKVNIRTLNGNITFKMPETMRASIEATVDRVAQGAKQPPIVSDFPMTPGSTVNRGISNSYRPTINSMTANRNGSGGSPVNMKASGGTIQIRLSR